MVSFDSVVRGVTKYVDRNVYAGMNDWQEVLARTAVGVALGSEDRLKENLMNNGIVKTFCIIDGNGNVDIERVASVLKTEIGRKEKLSFKVPVFGTFTFTPSDVDDLIKMIMEG